MSMPPHTCIVVLNWNGANDTLACLASLDKTVSPSYRVLVVDNGSTDGSVERIRSSFPGTEILELPENLGYSGGNNAGFGKAMEMQDEFVVFLNNDTIADRDFCTPLVETLLRKPEVGITVPKILYLDHPDTIWYAGGIARLSVGLVKHVGIREKDGPRFNRPGITGYATGCCFAMRCRDFRKAGGFDEGFGMYAEDVDLSLRVRAMGKSIEYVPASKVWHKVSASLAGNLMKKQFRKSSALWRLFRKHRAWSGMALYPLLLPFRAVMSISGAVMRKNAKQ
ncbi:MAG: glycosyltransferase family 2 protein [Chlorobiaceae bacterium]|jgi:GT2 family glycosyltransferase|nr:glycosyltransferase family 2 protein [Chlorobiaceae bacterium]